REKYQGVEELKVAVMGCVVNGPGESKHAHLGISLPGTGESPRAPVYVDGRMFTTLQGPSSAQGFDRILDEYVDSHDSLLDSTQRLQAGVREGAENAKG